MADALSLSDARRIALAAQGLDGRRPKAGTRIDRRHVRRVLDRIGVLQIDSVNVLARSHELPLFSRLGAHPRDLLPSLAYEHRELFEYWGHQASYLPVAHQPLFRFRMARARGGESWGSLTRLARERPEFLRSVLAEVRTRGPLAASELTNPGKKAGPWWGWADGKLALEWLFWAGDVMATTRRNFERIYDLTERVLPAEVLARPTPTEPESRRTLLTMAARALGIGVARDVADYYRLGLRDSRAQIDELVEEGTLVPVRVQGWSETAYLHKDATVPRRAEGRALLSPFDSLIWERARTERLFGFHLRLEIYVPQPKRVHGYYVLPFLLGDRLVARVDLKADRKAGVLRVLGAYSEEGTDKEATSTALAEELAEMAGWLGVGAVVVGRRGDLARGLRAAVA